MQNKKGAISVTVLIIMILSVIVFIVLFKIDMLLAGIIEGGAEDQVCFWSATLSSFSKIGPKTVTDLKCVQRKVIVMLNEDDQDNDEDLAKACRDKNTYCEFIHKKIKKSEIRKLAEQYKEESETNFDIKRNEERVLIYRLNEIVAKELKKCWGNLGRGRYDLFDEDISLIEYKEGTFEKEDSISVKLLKSLQIWKADLEPVPKVCWTCSKISFYKTVQTHPKLKGKVIDLKPFLLNNPVEGVRTPEAISYYEFLQDDIKQSDFFRPEYKYTVNKMQSVSFLRMNIWGYLGEVTKRVIEWQWGEKLSDIFSERDYKEDGDVLAVDLPLLFPDEEESDYCD